MRAWFRAWRSEIPENALHSCDCSAGSKGVRESVQYSVGKDGPGEDVVLQAPFL